MSDHEFTEQQGQFFVLMAAALRRFAFAWGLFSILILLTGLVIFFAGTDTLPDRYSEVLASIVLIVVGAIGLILSYLLLSPVDKFRGITTTRGQDMSWLLKALNELSEAQSLLRFMVALVLFAVVIVYWNVVT